MRICGDRSGDTGSFRLYESFSSMRNTFRVPICRYRRTSLHVLWKYGNLSKFDLEWFEVVLCSDTVDSDCMINGLSLIVLRNESILIFPSSIKSSASSLCGICNVFALAACGSSSTGELRVNGCHDNSDAMRFICGRVPLPICVKLTYVSDKRRCEMDRPKFNAFIDGRRDPQVDGVLA